MMFPFGALQSAAGELETLPVKYLRWTLNTVRIQPYTPIDSSEFQFQGAEWSLDFCQSHHYDRPLHGLYLELKSAESRKPILVTVQLETEKSGRIVTELSQETLIFTDTKIPKRIIWMKYDTEVLEADPKFSRTGILKFLVVLKGGGAIPMASVSSLCPPSDSSTQAESTTDTSATSSQFLLNLNTGTISCLDNLSEDLAKHLDSDSKSNAVKGKTSSKESSSVKNSTDS